MLKMQLPYLSGESLGEEAALQAPPLKPHLTFFLSVECNPHFLAVRWEDVNKLRACGFLSQSQPLGNVS